MVSNCQIWHQLSWSFLFLGFFHGVGVVSVHAWRSTRRRIPTVHQWVRKTPDIVAIWVTFTWFSVGNIVFMTEPAQLWVVLQRLGVG